VLGGVNYLQDVVTCRNCIMDMGCKWLNLDLQKLSQLEYQWLLVDLKSVSFKSLSRKVKKSYVYIYVYIYISIHTLQESNMAMGNQPQMEFQWQTDL
jgi:hypothetical protein